MKFKFLVCLVLVCGSLAAQTESTNSKLNILAQELTDGSLLNEKLTDLDSGRSNRGTGFPDPLHNLPANETAMIEQLEKQFKQAVGSVATARNGGTTTQNGGNILGFFTDIFHALSSPGASDFALSKLLPGSEVRKTQLPEERSNLGVSKKMVDIQNSTMSPLADRGNFSIKNSSMSPLADRGNFSIIAELACFLEVDPGICRAVVPRWYFNSTDATCRLFSYGGCHGNKNNFKNEHDCYATCTDEIPCKTDPAKVCFLDESLCRNASFSCRAYPQAECMVRPCTCQVEFENSDGEVVNCSDSVDLSNLTKVAIDTQDEIHCPDEPEKICRLSASECVNATCPEKPEAKCIVLPCTCKSIFLDSAGIWVNCTGSFNGSTSGNHTADSTEKKCCQNIAAGIIIFVLLVFLISAFSVGIFRKCKKTHASYSTFPNFSSSMSDLAEKAKESYTDYAVNRHFKETLV